MLLALPAIYLFGLWLAPPRPIPSTATVPPLVGDAIWARADGGRATELKPLNPINFISHRVCRALAARTDDPQQRGERRAECMKSLPAIQAADYLSGVHMRDEHVDPQSWRMGISQVATAAWLTRSWTKVELVDTLAARGEFGFNWRGIEAAAHGYFNREAAALDLPQAALLAGLIGGRGADPWCEPSVAAEIRGRVLERMRDNQAIDGEQFQSASTSSLGLGPEPANHQPCRQ